LNGYALDKKVVDEGSVKEAAKDLKLGKKLRRIWIPVLSCIAIALAVLFFIYLHNNGYLMHLYNSLIPAVNRMTEVISNAVRTVFIELK
jgi:hypothetical protein